MWRADRSVMERRDGILKRALRACSFYITFAVFGVYYCLCAPELAMSGTVSNAEIRRRLSGLY